MKKALEKGNKMWNVIRRATNTDNNTLPRRINHEGKMVTSSKEIANIFINFFKHKIEEIPESLRESDLDLLLFLKFLIP